MARQKLGQHWIDDHRVCEHIAETIALTPDETCIEIGGGKGALTKRLAKICRRLIVYEIDHIWADHLRAFGPGWAGGAGKIEVREIDALRIDWTREALNLKDSEPVVVTGNLPYYIASSLFLSLAWGELDFCRAIFLIQKEVARRIAANPGETEYGRLSVSLGAFLTSEILFDVPPGAFKPPPKVDSSVIRLVPRPKPLVDRESMDLFERTVRAAFHMRRKTLKNNLRAGFQNVPDDRINEIICFLNLSLTVRAQEVGVQEFVALSKMLAQ